MGERNYAFTSGNNRSLAIKMVKWILNYAKDPELNYFVGLQGSLPLNETFGMQ